MEYVLLLVARFVAVTVVLVFHEFAHAFAAHKCGDSTAKHSGRMTLNPAKHFDTLGLLSFVLVGFGWAKPVPVNPYNFKHYRRGAFWTAIAGVLTNFLMAFVFYPLLILVLNFVCPAFEGMYASIFLGDLFFFFYAYSLSFCVFNLLPFYPLDGFRIVDALSRKKGSVYRFLRQYGYYILLGLMLISMLASYVPFFAYIDILGYFSSFAMNILSKPITLFWDWILGMLL